MIVGDGQEYTGPPREEYRIMLLGLDDVTAFTLDLYPDEAEVLAKVSRVSEQVVMGGPVLVIEKAPGIVLNATWEKFA